MSDRVFLDANVLFSAAYRVDSGLRALWKRADCQLCTSRYAREEASRNLDDGEALDRLDGLLTRVEIVPEARTAGSETWGLPAKDVPIMAAALRAHCSHLLTGDLKHFKHLIGQSVDGALVLRPAEYLRS